jgi:TRAP-type mannitol/chloroaromatic compound transport system permease large subunit
MSEGPAYPSAPGAVPAQPSEGVSFSEEQRESLRALSASMSFVGVCLMLFGLLLGVLALGALYIGFATSGLALAAGIATAIALAYIPAAWWAMSAGRSLSALVRTRGRDAERLMEAIGHLRMLFGFARAVIIVQALIIAAAGGILVWCTFVMDKGGKCWGPLG